MLKFVRISGTLGMEGCARRRLLLMPLCPSSCVLLLSPTEQQWQPRRAIFSSGTTRTRQFAGNRGTRE